MTTLYTAEGHPIAQKPVRGVFYRHHKGTVYQVDQVCQDETAKPVDWVYYHDHKGREFTRPLSEWNDAVPHVDMDGGMTFRPRYERIGPPPRERVAVIREGIEDAVRSLTEALQALTGTTAEVVNGEPQVMPWLAHCAQVPGGGPLVATVGVLAHLLAPVSAEPKTEVAP